MAARRAFVNDQPVGVGAAAAAGGDCWSRCRASTTRSAWPIPRPMPGCSTPSAGSEPRAHRRRRRAARLARGRARRWPRRGRRSPPPSATRNSCATRSRNCPPSRPEEGEEEELSPGAPAPAAGRAARRERSPPRWPNCSRATAAAAARPTRCAAPPARWNGCRRRTTRPAGRSLARARRRRRMRWPRRRRCCSGCCRRAGPTRAGWSMLEDRLFGLRAAARKHGVAVVELPALLATLKDRLGALDAGTGRGRRAGSRPPAPRARAYLAAGAGADRGARGARRRGSRRRWRRNCRR